MQPESTERGLQEVLEEREARIRAILDTAVDGIITIDEKGTIISVNPAAERIFGYGRDEVEGRNVSVLMPSPYREQHDRYLQSYLNTGVKRIIGLGREVEGQRRDGTRFPLELAVNEFRVSSGRYFAGIVRDITERRRVEEELRQSQQRYEALSTIAPVGIFRTDLHGKCRYTNPRWSELTGLSPERAMGDGWLQAVHADDRGRVSSEWLEAVRRRKAFQSEFRFRRPDGGVSWVVSSATEEQDGEARLIGYVGTFTDISESKRAEAHLRQQEKMAAVGELASGIAHEVGNPLASISAVAQNIARRTKDQSIRDKLKLIGEHIERVNKIVRQMVDFSRPPRSEWKLSSINDVVESAIGMVRYDKRARHVTLELELAEELPPTYVMPDLLGQVFINLSLNAFDALASVSPEKTRRLRIHTREAGGSPGTLEIVFDDSGPGIPPDIESRVMDPFFTTKEVGRGTGLGLSVSHGIVKEHGGRILVDGRPGEGARFTVEVPVRRTPPPDTPDR